MKSLREYTDILSEKVTLNPDGSMPPVQTVNGVTMNAQGPSQPAAAPAGATSSGSANPWEGKDPAKAAAWAKLSGEGHKWLGMADPTDTIILQRAPKKGAAVAAPAAPAAPAGTPVADAVAASGQPDDATGVDAAVAAQADNSGAPPTAATNFDSRPFGKAYQTAQAQGLKQFSWKGKPYAVKAKAAQGAKPAKPAPQMNNPGTMNPQGMDFSQMTAESTGYSEDQPLARIVELARR